MITRKISIISGVVAILIVAGVFGFITQTNNDAPKSEEIQKKQDPASLVAQDIAPLITTSTSKIEKATIIPEEKNEITAIKKTAKVFVEFYGTYALPSSLSNVESLKSLVSNAFYTKMQAQKTMLAKEPSQRMVTEALAVKIVSNEENRAEVEVTTLRAKTLNGTKETWRQKMTLTLVQSNGTWLVDNASWNPSKF